MPQNKKESLIFTVLMCGFMVFWMSVYNVSLHMGFSMQAIKYACLGFPLAYITGMLLDWFVVSHLAKKIAFKIVKPESKAILKILAISGCMVCGMVICMSLYGAIEVHGFNNNIWLQWAKNIPVNFIMALPVQFLIAGPVVRFIFRKICPAQEA